MIRFLQRFPGLFTVFLDKNNIWSVVKISDDFDHAITQFLYSPKTTRVQLRIAHLIQNQQQHHQHHHNHQHPHQQQVSNLVSILQGIQKKTNTMVGVGALNIVGNGAPPVSGSSVSGVTNQIQELLKKRKTPEKPVDALDDLLAALGNKKNKK